MSSSYPYGVPNDTKTTGMPPAYLENIPMTSPRRLHPDVYDEAMPYRPREEAMPYRPQERSMEKAFRQLCCGSCWGFCAWIAGIVLILAGIIVVAVVLVSKSKHSAVAVPPASSTSPTQLTSVITITTASQQPSISISTFTVSLVQPSTFTSAISSMTTSIISLTSTTTLTVSPPQVSTVTTSISGSATTLTTTSVSTASAAAASKKTSLLQTINAPPNKVVPECFQEWLDNMDPGLFTGQSYTTTGTHEMWSTVDGLPTREALVTNKGVVLGGTATVWPLCGKSTLSSYSVIGPAVASHTSSTTTITSVITTITGQKQKSPLPTRSTTASPPTPTTSLLPAPAHSNLAALRRQAHVTVSSGSGRRPMPVNSISASTTDALVTYVQSLNIGTIRRTQTVIYTPGVHPHTSTPNWQHKIRTDAPAPRDALRSISSAQRGHPTASPITLVETLAQGPTTRKEIVTFTPGFHPYTSTPDWQRKTRTDALLPRLVPNGSITLTETLVLGSTTRKETVTYTPGVHPYTSTPDWQRKAGKGALADRHVHNGPITIIETLALESTTRKETLTYTPGISPYASTPDWQRPSKTEAIIPRYAPKSSFGGQPKSAVLVTLIEALALGSTTRKQTVTFTPGIYPYTSTPAWRPHTHTHKRDALPQASSSTSPGPGSPLSAVICALEPNQCTTLLTTSSKLTSVDIGPPITASSSAPQSGNRNITALGTESLPAHFSQIRTSSTQTLPTTGTVSLDSVENPPPTSTPDGNNYRYPKRGPRQMPDRSLASKKKSAAVGRREAIIIGIVFGSLIFLVFTVGLAVRWFRHRDSKKGGDWAWQ